MIAAKQRLGKKKKKRTSRITPLRVYTQECGSLSTHVSLKIIWLLPSDVLTTLSLDNSLSVLLKLNKQLKISNNNSPRTNQGISYLNTRNMEFFRLELEGIWQFEILEAQNSEFFFFFFFGTPFCLLLRVSLSFRFFFYQQLAFENNEIRFRNN
jgi:hypothetical protein